MADDLSEINYVRGSRAAWTAMLQECLMHLGEEAQAKHNWLMEREQVIAQLRQVCESHGDNDWDETCYLPDVIEKHLADHLYA